MSSDTYLAHYLYTIVMYLQYLHIKTFGDNSSYIRVYSYEKCEISLCPFHIKIIILFVVIYRILNTKC